MPATTAQATPIEWAVIHPVTGATVIRRLHHPHRSQITQITPQPTQTASGALGTFEIPLYDPQTDDWRSNYDEYAKLDYNFRVEAYLGEVGADDPVFTGVIRELPKAENDWTIKGVDSLFLLQASKTLRTEGFSGTSDALVKLGLTGYGLVYADDCTTNNLSNYTNGGGWTYTANDEGIPCYTLSTGNPPDDGTTAVGGQLITTTSFANSNYADCIVEAWFHCTMATLGDPATNANGITKPNSGNPTIFAAYTDANNYIYGQLLVRHQVDTLNQDLWMCDAQIGSVSGGTNTVRAVSQVVLLELDNQLHAQLRLVGKQKNATDYEWRLLVNGVDSSCVWEIQPPGTPAPSLSLIANRGTQGSSNLIAGTYQIGCSFSGPGKGETQIGNSASITTAAVPAPSAPVVSAVTVSPSTSLPAGSYTVKATYTDILGETTPSTGGVVTITAGQAIHVAAISAGNATGMNFYFTAAPGGVNLGEAASKAIPSGGTVPAFNITANPPSVLSPPASNTTLQAIAVSPGTYPSGYSTAYAYMTAVPIGGTTGRCGSSTNAAAAINVYNDGTGKAAPPPTGAQGYTPTGSIGIGFDPHTTIGSPNANASNLWFINRTARFQQGNIQTGTQTIQQILSNMTMLELLNLAAALESWVWRKRPKAGLNNDIIDFGPLAYTGATGFVGADRSIGNTQNNIVIHLREGFEVIDGETAPNAEMLASEVVTSTHGKNNNGGEVIWRNLAAVQKYGLLATQMNADGVADPLAARVVAKWYADLKGTPGSAKTVTAVAYPIIFGRDVHETDFVSLTSEKMGQFQQRVRLFSWTMNEMTPQQELVFDQFPLQDPTLPPRKVLRWLADLNNVGSTTETAATLDVNLPTLNTWVGGGTNFVSSGSGWAAWGYNYETDFAAFISIPNGMVFYELPIDVAAYDPFGMVTANGIMFPVNGLYLVTCKYNIATATSSQALGSMRLDAQLGDPTGTAYVNEQTLVSVDTMLGDTLTCLVYGLAGNIAKLRFRHNYSGGNMNIGCEHFGLALVG